MFHSIMLWDRVRLPDGREGAVIRGNPDGEHVTVSLLGGKTVNILAAVLTPIEKYSDEKVGYALQVELADSLKTISRISVCM